MRKVAIVTDTTACIPPVKVEEYGIEVVPVPLVIEGKMYRDGIDITPEQFYDLMHKAKKTPSTSASAPEPYLEAFRKAAKKAAGIICFTEPARFSAMYISAAIAMKTAANSLPGTRIEVIEGTTAAAGMGLVALEAARAADAGRTLEEVKAAATSVMQRTRLYAALDTVQYLVRSGRVPQVAALVNSILAIKPVFTLNHDGAKTVALPRTMKGAIEKMFRLVQHGTARDQPLHVAVMHANALQNATVLKDKIEAGCRCREIYITEFTPVMGAHTGPGLVGVSFWGE